MYPERQENGHDRSRSDSLLLRGDDSGVATSQDCSALDCDDAEHWSGAGALEHGSPGRVCRECGGAAPRTPPPELEIPDERSHNTIRQRYYPEGGWGWLVLFCGVLAQLLAHGLHVGFGVLLPEILRKFPRTTYVGSGELA